MPSVYVPIQNRLGGHFNFYDPLSINEHNLTEDELKTMIDKLYIENLTLSNNTLNTSNSSNASNINIGINITNSPLIIKNSYIEVSNNPQLSTNYGININSNI